MRLVLGIIAILFYTVYCMYCSSVPHHCPINNCEQEGHTTFTTSCEEGTDCYIVDSIHFFNPEMNYDQIETLMFGAEITNHENN